MKKTGFNLICKLWCTVLLCAGILTGCDLLSGESEVMTDIDGDGIIDGTNPSNPSNPSTPSIRPYRIDMAGVQGFAIVENTSKAPRTKADKNGDGVDDDMPNGNGSDMGSESVNTSPYALYTIDENGELHVSIFYFEVVQSEGDSTDTSYTEVLKEVSNTLQIVPSLVTDLGKYILFSGCEYQIIASDISDEALSICQTYINENTRGDMTYMIRKSDGALFDLSGWVFFCYCEYHEWHTGKYKFYYAGSGFYIPSVTYPTSIQNNLFVLGITNPRAVYKVEDNGDAVDFKQMTQDVVGGFCIDSSENIYVANWNLGDDYGKELHIYGANGGFNYHRFNSDMWFIDIKTDESGDPLIFLTSGNSKFLSARLSNCSVEVLSEADFSGHFYNYKAHQYIGYYNDSYNWYDYSSILSYNKNTHQWSLRTLSTDILQLLDADYDTIVYGSKTYCARLNGNSVEVIEIELASETYRTYNFNIDMNFIPISFGGRIIQGFHI